MKAQMRSVGLPQLVLKGKGRKEGKDGLAGTEVYHIRMFYPKVFHHAQYTFNATGRLLTLCLSSNVSSRCDNQLS